jgi:hypothetical protein
MVCYKIILKNKENKKISSNYGLICWEGLEVA